MLGHSSAGKTTYMAALYYRMTKGVYNYKMRYDEWNNYWYKHYTQGNRHYTREEAKKEGKELETTSLNVSKGIYPPPTAIRQEYVFRMGHKTFREVEFNWFDYRGGALMERSSQSSESASLIVKIKKSDALIVFLDGTKLEEPLQKNEREFRRLVYLVKNAISGITVGSGSSFPISFVITKNDLCRDVLNSEGYKYFRANILNDIQQSEKVAALVTMISVNREHIYNVQWPLFFSIRHCMHKYKKEVIGSYQYREEHRGFFDSIKEFFTEDDKKWTNMVVCDLQESKDNLIKILNKENRKSLYLI